MLVDEMADMDVARCPDQPDRALTERQSSELSDGTVCNAITIAAGDGPIDAFVPVGIGISTPTTAARLARPRLPRPLDGERVCARQRRIEVCE
jgi:hypothetical protein